MLQKHDIDILNCIYKNSRMASDCIKQVSEKCDDDELRSYIDRQQKHYESTCKELKSEIEGAGAQVAEVPAMETAMAHMGIGMKAFVDDSRNNLAKMMYNGTNMGIIDIAETVNHCHNAGDATLRKAEQLLSREEQYADGLKKFL
ncbi:MAG: DUF2383 domain-containing protein [Ruminiclostridium sp.]|nr:DUF2383 domain-containing protein [Ruminiclostridium sp.]